VKRFLLWSGVLWPGLALAAILFYSIPLFSRQATIHWDHAEVSYPAQKFFADSLRTGGLPQWTPYLNSGIPFLADPRTGAWNPLHWPFFALWITPRTMVWELAMHAFLALAGAYLLGRKLFGAQGPALLGAILYAWGGYFAAHSSLLGQFEAAALFPWLIWAALGAFESGILRWIAFTTLIAGLILLTGDGLATLESVLTLVFIAAALRVPWKRALDVVTPVAILAAVLGAVALLPAIELHSQSHPVPSGATFHFGPLATLVAADYYGIISGVYSGPEEPRQNYFYGGLLLLPLAVAGFARRERAALLAAIIAPTVLFDLARRPPGDAWFPAALGLAMAATSGVVWVGERTERRYLWVALTVLTAADLFFWNMYKNPLVFARAPFSEIYGQSRTGESKLPFPRTWAPFVPVGLGPADGSLISRTEVTYGSGLAELDRYTAYIATVDRNPKLLNGLGVTDLILGRGRQLDNPGRLGRVSAPPRVQFVADRKAALAALATLDPAQSAVVEAEPRNLTPAVQSIEITAYTGDSYHIRYTASSDSLLRIAVPFYPGWGASVDGADSSVVPVDEALMGVFVPSGSHELILQFQPRWFRTGVGLSVAGAIALVLGLVFGA
jgi:Bacterial membrane protein YfhO